MSSTLEQRPFVETVDGPRLLGGRCDDCAAVLFPFRAVCSTCGVGRVSEIHLPAEGTLWSWTVQGFPPKPPYRPIDPDASFEPYGVGYVELPEALRVESILTSADPDVLRVGMDMRLTVIGAGDSGRFAFEPAGPDSGSAAEMAR